MKLILILTEIFSFYALGASLRNKCANQLIVCFFTGSIQCTMEGSCAGRSLTPTLAVLTWPTPFYLPHSLPSLTTTLTTRSCQLHALLWWVFTSPSPGRTQVKYKQEWSVQCQQMSVKGLCHWGLHMGWPAREGEACPELMFLPRYGASTRSLSDC